MAAKPNTPKPAAPDAGPASVVAASQAQEPSTELIDLRLKVSEQNKTISELRSKIASLTGIDSGNPELEKMVREKISAGLTREQAVAVAKEQMAHDAAQNKNKSESAKA